MRRESTFPWYTANTEALEELLGFLYAECCTRRAQINIVLNWFEELKQKVPAGKK